MLNTVCALTQRSHAENGQAETAHNGDTSRNIGLHIAGSTDDCSAPAAQVDRNYDTRSEEIKPRTLRCNCQQDRVANEADQVL